MDTWQKYQPWNLERDGEVPQGACLYEGMLVPARKDGKPDMRYIKNRVVMTETRKKQREAKAQVTESKKKVERDNKLKKLFVLKPPIEPDSEEDEPDRKAEDEVPSEPESEEEMVAENDTPEESEEEEPEPPQSGPKKVDLRKSVVVPKRKTPVPPRSGPKKPEPKKHREAEPLRQKRQPAERTNKLVEQLPKEEVKKEEIPKETQPRRGGFKWADGSSQGGRNGFKF